MTTFEGLGINVIEPIINQVMNRYGGYKLSTDLSSILRGEEPWGTFHNRKIDLGRAMARLGCRYLYAQ